MKSNTGISFAWIAYVEEHPVGLALCNMASADIAVKRAGLSRQRPNGFPPVANC